MWKFRNHKTIFIEWHFWYFLSFTPVSSKRNVNNFSFCKGNNIRKTKICLVTKFTHEKYERDVSTCRLLSWDGYKQKIYISRNWIYSSTFIIGNKRSYTQTNIRMYSCKDTKIGKILGKKRKLSCQYIVWTILTYKVLSQT